MANVDENLNLGEIDETLPLAIRNQFEKLYNELETRWRQQATEINQKPDVVFNEFASRSPPTASLTVYRIGTILVDLVPATPTAWQLANKIPSATPGNPVEAVWIQLA